MGMIILPILTGSLQGSSEMVYKKHRAMAQQTVCVYFLEELPPGPSYVTHPISVAHSPSNSSHARDPGQGKFPRAGGETTPPHKKGKEREGVYHQCLLDIRLLLLFL